jgi:esterase/lipase
MKKTLILTGFGQNPEQLKRFLQTKINDTIDILDYSKFKNYEDLKNNVFNNNYDRIIGWSLGGQIACRLISDKILTTKSLFLISTPYKFLTDYKFHLFKLFLMQDYQFALHKLNDLIESSQKLENIDNFENLETWLDELEDFDCVILDFSNFPKTFYLAGRNDNVVSINQIGQFRERIKNFKSLIIESSHAPHYDFFKYDK